MKKYSNFFLTFFVLTFFVLTSCSTQKRLAHAINKHGQKESLDYIITHYPYLFKKDSIIIIDTVTVFLHDTIKESGKLDAKDVAMTDSSLSIKNDSLTLEINKLQNGLYSFNLKLKQKPKEIKVPIKVPCPPTITPIACPDCPKCPYVMPISKQILVGLILILVGYLLRFVQGLLKKY